ncbi:hypothetical protein QR680_013339 [Steinernema hermaphroditum]|uniref:Major facilitator superfamily (MFS) profile domain-containing protein n=1 Tax=Steinernema hermaphroditum TaxID=289476 RepID=A0AA39M259_9BILA|nr:hypothetical protein QR680_013339 [Steinernema hermaphroditum]
MFPPVLFYVIFVHGLLSNGNVILSLMFNGLSLPLHELFNASVQNQYSISLDDKGMSLVISILPNFEFLGNLACVLLVPMKKKGDEVISGGVCPSPVQSVHSDLRGELRAQRHSALHFIPSIFGSRDTWQFIHVACALMEVLYFVCAFRLPESPKWLMAWKKSDDIKSLQFHHGEHVDVGKLKKTIKRVA